jgi:hypothetical protein
MKIWHLGAVIALSILSGWWLDRQNPKPHSRSRAPSALAHIRFSETGPDEIVRLPHSAMEFIAQLHQRPYARAEILVQMTEWSRSEGIQRPEISVAARRFLASDDRIVQAAALELISTQPPSAENLDAILGNILAGYDAELIEQAMLELERYTAPADGDRIDQALGEAMTMGAPFVAREISAHITPFVNERSYNFFQDVAERLPRQSYYRIHLESSLADFRNRKAAG